MNKKQEAALAQARELLRKNFASSLISLEFDVVTEVPSGIEGAPPTKNTNTSFRTYWQGRMSSALGLLDFSRTHIKSLVG
jgi:hypothetical protein